MAFEQADFHYFQVGFSESTIARRRFGALYHEVVTCGDEFSLSAGRFQAETSNLRRL